MVTPSAPRRSPVAVPRVSVESTKLVRIASPSCLQWGLSWANREGGTIRSDSSILRIIPPRCQKRRAGYCSLERAGAVIPRVKTAKLHAAVMLAKLLGESYAFDG